MGKGKRAFKQMMRQKTAEAARETKRKQKSMELRTASVQCCGVTSGGRGRESQRCKVFTRNPNRMCARHQKQTKHKKEEWLVESEPQYTNVSAPHFPVGRKYGVELDIASSVMESRVGQLTIEDLKFL